MKLNFGCGGNRIDGWDNYDIDLDVTKLPLPFPDGYADGILAEHLGEHLSGPQLLRFITECYRILKFGESLRLCCPVIGPWLKRDHAIDLTLGHGHMLVLNEESMRAFLWMAGFDQTKIRRTDRHKIDGHWAVIGTENDDIETCRMEAVK